MAATLGSSTFTQVTHHAAGRRTPALRAPGPRPVWERKGAHMPTVAGGRNGLGEGWRVHADSLRVEQSSMTSQRGGEQAPMGFSFSPGALLLPYYLGVAVCERPRAPDGAGVGGTVEAPNCRSVFVGAIECVYRTHPVAGVTTGELDRERAHHRRHPPGGILRRQGDVRMFPSSIVALK